MTNFQLTIVPKTGVNPSAIPFVIESILQAIVLGLPDEVRQGIDRVEISSADGVIGMASGDPMTVTIHDFRADTIATEKQYAIALRQIRNFTAAIEDHDSTPRPEAIHPTLWQASREGMWNQLQDLQTQAHRYEQGRVGNEPFCPCCREFMEPRRLWHSEDMQDYPSGVWICKNCVLAAGEPFEEAETPA